MGKNSASKEHVEAVAQTIMANFIPKNPEANVFSFHFTLPPAENYRAQYAKNKDGKNWDLISVNPASDN
ncbi:hypothetical protein [Pedobacter sp. SYP-B3415]|uniref:hypothetical protein n=1 Tax=Pedobacter sp. SYP-B3415 TaxID=2496641 RepID=UPI00101C4C92|nr:hypothetical protein [Pedobacter sp. SYP-B3415]